MGPVFKRLAMNYPPILFHPINSITAYKGQIIYDTPATEAKAQTPVPYLQWHPAPGVTPPRRRPDGDLSALMLPPTRDPGQVRRRSRLLGPAPPAARRPDRARTAAAPARRLLRPSAGGRARLTARRSSRARRRTVAHDRDRLGAVLLAGCQFGGLNSLDMPGTAGHGTGSYTITVELPDVATLPQNSPVMVDDVTVGSVSGIEAVQRPDGTFYAAVKLSLDENVKLPANATRRSRRRRCWGLSTSSWLPPVDGPGEGQADGRLARSRWTDTGRYPTTEEVLSSLGVVVNKGNLGALQDITDETYNAVAGRQGQFADLIPGLPS